MHVHDEVEASHDKMKALLTTSNHCLAIGDLSIGVLCLELYEVQSTSMVRETHFDMVIIPKRP